MAAFPFDEWASLARNDPAAFERRRAAVIAAFLAAHPPERRQRLERLQWRIDRERERGKTPLGACIRLSDMMWQRFAGPDGLNETLQSLRRGRRGGRRQRPAARVLPFRRPS